MGYLFYIILQGRVGIKVPVTVDFSFGAEDLFAYCLQNMDNIFWQKFPNGDSIRAEIKGDAAKIGVTPKNIHKKLSMFLHRLKVKDVGIPFGIYSIMDGKKGPGDDPYKMYIFKEVAELKEGAYFGELALQDTKPRTATVFCKDDCMFGTLSKRDYQALVGTSQKRKQAEEIRFFKQYRIFANAVKNKMKHLRYYMVPKRFDHNQVVFKEG